MMGWKNVKEHYRIDHQVQVTEKGICIGSPYIHAIIVISHGGALVKGDDRTLNDNLGRYQAEMRADPAKLRELVLSPDTFDASIPVYTYRGAEIIEKHCEVLGWPNVTHDGDMMFENTFFAEREHAIEAARSNCESSIALRRMEISDQQQRLEKSKLRLQELLANATKLGLPIAAKADKPSPGNEAITGETVRGEDYHLSPPSHDPAAWRTVTNDGTLTHFTESAEVALQWELSGFEVIPFYRTIPSPLPHVVGAEERGIGIGMAIAAGIIMRVWGRDEYAKEILGAAGLDTLDKLKASGIDQYDIDALMPVVATATEGSGE